MRYVLAITQTRTFAAAARELEVDHTTVGRRLSAIEQALGTRLFERTSAGLSPTTAGERVLARATEIETQMLALQREVAGNDARPEGPMRLTAVDWLFDAFLIPQLNAFYKRYPKIELTLISDTRLFDFGRREADVGIRFFKPKDLNLVGRRIGKGAVAFYASRKYLEERGQPSGGWKGHAVVHMPVAPPYVALYKEHAPKAQVVMRVSFVSHLTAALRAGVGIGLLQCLIGEADPNLQRVTPPVLTEELWAVHHVDMRHSARVRVLVDFLSEAARKSESRLFPRA